MNFDTPATPNPIDRLKVVGRPFDRIDGRLKVCGSATYAYEHHDVTGSMAYGYVVGAAIAKGTIVSIDSARARSAPGVIAIVTHETAGPLGVGEFYVQRVLAGPQVDHYDQIVALVIAETFEMARAAAAMVDVEYRQQQGSFDLAAKLAAPVAKPGPYGSPPETSIGNFSAAFDSAPVKIDATYRTPDHAHAMMEPHATIAVWKGDRLTCWTSVQQMNWAVRDLSKILGIPKETVRVLSPFIGGGFGGKGTVQCDPVMAALGARASGRPVKLALQRGIMFNNLIHRPATIQRIRIGAATDGRINAIGHDCLSGNLPGGRTEPATLSTRALYAAPNRMTRQRLAVLDLAEGNAMRAPGEAPGMMALEIAMDELAEKLSIDPVRLRVLNDTQVDPENPDRPFSTRAFVECLRTGSDRFGWDRRHARPAQVRDANRLVGMGVAAAIRGAPISKAGARVRLNATGTVTVETDMTDIGTGSYTIVAQTAAEMMGVSIDRVAVRLGDSSFPETPGSGGQQGAPSVTAGVYAACTKLREEVARRLGFGSLDVVFADGEVRSGDVAHPLAIAAASGDIVVEDVMEYGDLSKRFAQQTFGAHFAEVAVDAATGEIRVRRMLCVAAAGRILNPKTARSQMIGGMTMGIGAALMEEMVVDKRKGFFVNHDLASYEVPVHADVPHLDVIFIDEVDPTMSPLQAKGVGELGLTGVAAAIANAVYNATGVRVRDYPITLDKFLDRLPEVA